MTHTFDDRYWDEVWAGDRGRQMATSPPNPHLVREVAGLTPGAALEAGCGAGTEAIWLASRGWRVTAVDIAPGALRHGAERAAAGGVADRVEWVRADLADWQPATRFDLVTTHYAHAALPQLALYDRLASWVAPGGTLLVVGHRHRDAAHEEQPGHDGPHHRPHHAEGRDDADGTGDDRPPASASATAAAITDRLDPAGWEVVTAEEPDRTVAGPGGRQVTLHDVVVRATRRR